MPPHRPFFRSTADELRELVDKNRHDLATIQLVAKELRKRTTSKARALARELEQIQHEGPPIPVVNSREDFPGDVDTENEQPTEVTTVAEPEVETVSETVEFQSVTATTLEQGPHQRPVHEDPASSVLSAWIALEALSPQTYRRPEDLASGDKRCVANIAPQLPWNQNERSRPNKKLFFQIVLVE